MPDIATSVRLTGSPVWLSKFSTTLARGNKRFMVADVFSLGPTLIVMKAA